MAGVLAGLAATVFLVLLEIATNAREAQPAIIWFLPLAGFFIGGLYHQYGRDVAAGNNLILDEIHDPKNITPARMAPFILLGTLITHLFGGSAGREGTAVQMSASLADQLNRFFKIDAEERKILLVCGTGAGFGAAIGAPWAGLFFGMEVLRVGRLRLFAFAESAIASFVAYGFTRLLHAPHSQYPLFEIPGVQVTTLAFVAAAGVIFGLTARVFMELTHWVEHAQKRFISYPPLKPALAGVILVVFFYLEGSYRYDGLGIPVIQEALRAVAPAMDPVYKTIFTALTVGSGFKGGEFIPLVFIGTTLGSALSLWLPAAFQLLAATGFAAVFAGAANTPVACTVMAMEIFGPRIGVYALVACLASFLVSGPRGIYKSQRRESSKPQALWATLKGLGSLFYRQR